MTKVDAIMRHVIRAAIALGGSLLAVFLMLDTQLSTPQTFASPLSPPKSRWGIHLGNHVYGEPWDEALLRRIDGDKGGIWPDAIVFLSRNLYDVQRNTSGDCRITNVSGKYPLFTNTGVFTGYLQRASAAGVKIVIRIWPSPGNFITSTHRILLSNNPASGDRCDEGSDPSRLAANRSYDDIGDEIVKIHEWNAAHGINEAGFEPANEPNTEWYRSGSNATPIQPDNPLAWMDMDAYFTNIYTYVHTFHPASQLRVFTPPMAQNNYAEMVRTGLDRCDPMGVIDPAGNLSSGYELMPNVFLYGYSNDGYTWHNYWALGFEDWVSNCDPNISPHGHHVDQWFPLSMREQMYFKITYITEADLRSPGSPMWGNLTDKDEQFGLTASSSISQFFNADLAVQHIAAWNLNITSPTEVEHNWHEAYRCNDIGQGLPALERPWFTRWWAGETPSYQVAPCYRVMLPISYKEYTTELIKNGAFDAGGTYWTTTTSYPSCTNPPIFGAIDGNNAAVLARCTYNTDTLSQTITIPTNVSSAQLTFQFRVEQNCNQPIYNDRLYVRIRDRTTGELVPLSSYDDSPPRSIWRSGVSADLTARRGHTLDVIFTATNDNDLRPAKFWIDDVSVQIAY